MLETLLLDCFEGFGRCEAEGLSAAVRQVPKGAAVLAFTLDGSAFRHASGLGNDVCCDRLLLVLQNAPGKGPRLTFLLLEMKGKNLAHALEQLDATLAAFRHHFSEPHRAKLRFVAVVISDRASPTDVTQADIRRFQQRHGASLYVRRALRNRTGADLTDLVRPWPE